MHSDSRQRILFDPLPSPASAGSPGSPAPGPNAAGSQPNPGSAGSPLTEADLARLLDARLEPLTQRLTGLSANVNRHGDELKKLATPAAGDKKPEGLEGQVRELQERQHKLEEREQRQRESAARQTIKAGLLSGGVDPRQADLFATVLFHGERERLVYDESGSDLSVAVRENETVRTPLSSYVAAYLQTDLGRAMLPASRNPQLPGGGSAPPAGARIRITRAQMADPANTKLVAENKAEIVD